MEGGVGDVPGDAPALVADPDADVLRPLGEQHLHGGQLRRAGVRLHRSAHRVLEQLEQDVVEVGRGVGQRRTHSLPLLVLQGCMTCK